jgi:5-methylcytosine-specific restriction enzyme subunit McrC
MNNYTVHEWDKFFYGDGEEQIPELFANRIADVAARSTLAGRGGSGVLEHGKKALRARGVVGIIAAKGCSLEILPKIEVSKEGGKIEQNAAIRKRLIHMLAVALNMKIDLGLIANLAWQQETLLEILIRIFCDKLTEAVRQGMPRSYITQEDDIAALRGRLNVTRQFTRHAVNPSRLACKFDVFSDDIVLNQIMRAAVTHLSGLSRSSENQRRLRELEFVYADITDVPPSNLQWGAVVIDRTNQRWQELLSMARLFLQNRYQTTTGGAGQGTALLFEMNVLFEEYIGRFVRKAAVGTGLEVSLQGGRLYCLTNSAEKGFFQTKPDIVIRQGNRVTHIIDTKWKRISSKIDDPKQGVSQGDIYQMMAYAQLYKAPRLTLLYPHHSELRGDELVQSSNKITGQEVIIETATIDVGNGEKMIERIRSLLIPEAHEVKVAI